MRAMDGRTIPELGEAIDARMEALGLTIAQALKRTGPTDEERIKATAFGDARKGLLRPQGRKVLYGVARALEWDPETLKRVVRRELPVHSLPIEDRGPIRLAVPPAPGTQEDLADRLSKLEDIVADLVRRPRPDDSPETQ